MSIDVASTGIQVHGGMGFIEETGAAQHYRDARILPSTKAPPRSRPTIWSAARPRRDGGAVANKIIGEVRLTATALAASGDDDLQAIGRRLDVAATALEQVVAYVAGNLKSNIKEVFAGSVPYLKLAGIVLGGWQMGRAALAARKLLDGDGAGDKDFYAAKIGTARFFADHFLTQADAYRLAIVEGGGAVQALSEAQF